MTIYTTHRFCGVGCEVGTAWSESEDSGGGDLDFLPLLVALVNRLTRPSLSNLSLFSF